MRQRLNKAHSTQEYEALAQRSEQCARDATSQAEITGHLVQATLWRRLAAGRNMAGGLLNRFHHRNDVFRNPPQQENKMASNEQPARWRRQKAHAAQDGAPR